MEPAAEGVILQFFHVHDVITFLVVCFYSCTASSALHVEFVLINLVCIYVRGVIFRLQCINVNCVSSTILCTMSDIVHVVQF